MKLNEFLNENNVTAFEYVENNVIINAVVEDGIFGINVDCSEIPSGTPVLRANSFEINGELLIVEGLELNIYETDML